MLQRIRFDTLQLGYLNRIEASTPMKQRELIDVFKSKTGLTKDQEVAEVFGQAHSNISAWAAERRSMPTDIKFRLLDHINFSADTERFVMCFGDLQDHKLRMEEDLSRIAAIKARNELKEDEAAIKSHPDLEMILETQALNGLTDKKLCEILCISESELQKIRSGKSPINSVSKARLAPLWAWTKARERAKDTPLPKVFEPFKNWLIEWDKRQVQK